MTIKFKILNALLAVLSLGSIIGCSDDKEACALQTNLETNSLSFTSEAKEAFDIKVITNNDTWDAKPDKTWCIVTKKSDDEFTVSAMPNTSTQAREEAIITVTACNAIPIKISVTQSGQGAILSITPQTPINFNAAGTGSYEIAVTTNQESWNAESHQTWCTVTRADGKFTVTAKENLTKDILKATITVSAGNAAKQTIAVTQAAATEEDSKEDNGKTIWEDTHWRWHKLKGNVKTVEEWDGSILEFNNSGKLLKHTIIGGYSMFEYDQQGRLIRKTDNPTNTLSQDEQESQILEITYGNHTKYIPLVGIGQFSDIMLLRGVVSVKSEMETLNFQVSDTQIMVMAKNELNGEINYSGDYPVSSKGYSKEIDEDEESEYSSIWEYKYGINYKFLEVSEKLIDEREVIREERKRTYKHKNTIYHLTETYQSSDSDYPSVNYKYQYDDKGRLIKKTSNMDDTLEYSSYIEDDKGNWIERKIGNQIQKRKITYF